MLHPPQTPKCGQVGVTRIALDLTIRSTTAFSNVGLQRVIRASTTSPASAPSTNTAFPSLRAMPWPSWSMDSMASVMDMVAGVDAGFSKAQF